MDTEKGATVKSRTKLKRGHSLVNIANGASLDIAFDKNIEGTPRKKSRVRNKSLISQSKISAAASTSKPVDEICVVCSNSCTVMKSLSCQFCDDFFHPVCCEMDPTLIANHGPLFRAIGWSCAACKADIRNLLASHRSGTLIMPVTELPRPSSVPNANISDVVDNGVIASSSIVPPPVLMITDSNAHTRNDIERVVRRTIKDNNYRKRNIIVSGLREEPSVDDATKFISLCETNLGYRPRLESNGLRRLGTAASNKHRRLLVRLASEQIASNLMRVAKELRDSDDPYTAENIFFNLDLSREEAKEAYERRKDRRTKKELAANNNLSSNNPNMSSETVADRQASTSSAANQSTSRLFINSRRRAFNPISSNESNLIYCGGSVNPSNAVFAWGERREQTSETGVSQGITTNNRFSLLDPDSLEFRPAAFNGATASNNPGNSDGMVIQSVCVEGTVIQSGCVEGMVIQSGYVDAA